MPRIFISYRRDDASGHAGRLYDVLVERFRTQDVFMDIDAIEPGTNFVRVIEDAVQACDVLLAVIGPRWLNSLDSSGKRRLDNPDDFVRLEIKTALERDIRVVPILVQNASMPSRDTLPQELAGLAVRQAFDASDARWRSDTARLVKTLERIPSKARARPSTSRPPVPTVSPLRVEPAPIIPPRLDRLLSRLFGAATLLVITGGIGIVIFFGGALWASISTTFERAQPDSTPTLAPAATAAAPAKPTLPVAAPSTATPLPQPPVAAVQPTVAVVASPTPIPPRPTATPAIRAAPLATELAGCPDQPVAPARMLKVGLVTDIDKIDDQSFNQSAWEGVQCAEKNLGAKIRFIESADSKDYGNNIDQFAQANYDVIVTVGSGLTDDTISAARKYSNIKFIGVDQGPGDTVPNLAGLSVDQDREGYLAGYLAGLLTKSGIVGQVLGSPILLATDKFGVGYINGATAARPGVKVLTVCHPGDLALGLLDFGWGKDTANQEMSQNADIIFAPIGLTASGALSALVAIVNNGGSVLGIGADSDQYVSLPEARSILVSSAVKLVTPSVFNLVKAVQDTTFKGGNLSIDVGLAPYHDLESRVPISVRQKMTQVTSDVNGGKTRTGWDKPTANCPQG